MATAKKKEAAPKETKALSVAPEAAMPATQAQDAAWGSEGLSNSDILVPKLLVMQGLSKLVSEGLANVGQIRDSLEGNLFGGMVKPKENPQAMEVIPFSTFRTWVIFEKRNGKDEYVKTVPITPENEAWPINEVVGGVEVRRDKCLNFYVLRPRRDQGRGCIPLPDFLPPHVDASRQEARNACRKDARLREATRCQGHQPDRDFDGERQGQVLRLRSVFGP
jgi:hypothetical protein